MYASCAPVPCGRSQPLWHRELREGNGSGRPSPDAKARVYQTCDPMDRCVRAARIREWPRPRSTRFVWVNQPGLQVSPVKGFVLDWRPSYRWLALEVTVRLEGGQAPVVARVGACGASEAAEEPHPTGGSTATMEPVGVRACPNLA